MEKGSDGSPSVKKRWTQVDHTLVDHRFLCIEKSNRPHSSTSCPSSTFMEFDFLSIRHCIGDFNKRNSIRVVVPSWEEDGRESLEYHLPMCIGEYFGH